MLRALPHLSGFVLPLAIVEGVRLGGVWTFLPLGLLLGFLPLADCVAGRNVSVPDDPASLERNVWFRAVTWLWVPVHAILLLWAVDIASSGNLTPVELVGLTLSMGLVAGTIGITFAHELVHRPSRFELGLGEILLAMTSYTHFAIEHVYGHHRHVGTPRDPATARFGESIYAFVPRSVLGGIASAWRFEVERLRRRGRPSWHPASRMLRYAATQVFLHAIVFATWGLTGSLFFAAQAAIAIALVETINYIEHYGLERRELAPGRFERLMPWHSWDSTHRLSNWLLINLARHSDHHLVASKRYQTLAPVESAPQLPAGYGAMFLAALCPPLWRRVMDPRVEEWRKARHVSFG